MSNFSSDERKEILKLIKENISGGRRGPQGPQGPQGPAGGGSDTPYQYTPLSLSTDRQIIPLDSGMINNSIYSTISGGTGNSITDSESSFIGSGDTNSILNGIRSSILSGTNNTASGSHATILGGEGNTSDGIYSTVCGNGNINNGEGSFCAGYLNRIMTNGVHSCILGGESNIVSNFRTGILAGNENTVSGDGSSISSGFQNLISGFRSFIGSGRRNTCSGFNSSVLCGEGNTCSGSWDSVLAGRNNVTRGLRCSVVCGQGNTAIGNESSILCGMSNNIVAGVTGSSILSGNGIGLTSAAMDSKTATAFHLRSIGGRSAKIISTSTGGYNVTINDHFIYNTAGDPITYNLPIIGTEVPIGTEYYFSQPNVLSAPGYTGQTVIPSAPISVISDHIIACETSPGVFAWIRYI